MASQVISITITAPTAQNLSDGLDLFVYQLGYQDLVFGAANPETKLAFAKRMTQEYWKSNIKIRKAVLAAQAASMQAGTDSDSTWTFT